MKIVSWNCNGAFRKKYHALEEFNADILIIQECENPADSTIQFQKWTGENYLWIGSNKNKGLGLFSRNGLKLNKLNWKDDNLELFLPFEVSGIPILAVWTKQANSPTFQYIGQLWKYLQLNNAQFIEHKPFVIGDFNSNAIWDVWDRWWNHSDVVGELSKLGIQSLYHHQHTEKQGGERVPTFYMHRNLSRPYHIDYVFLPESYLLSACLEIGKPDRWLEHSDHVPLFITT